MNVFQRTKDSFSGNENKEACKGLFFRGRTSMYFTGDVVGHRIELRLLKRKSCPGCERCEFLRDDLQEFAVENSLSLEHIQDGKLYKLIVRSVGVDYETGICDDWSLEFDEVNDE